MYKKVSTDMNFVDRRRKRRNSGKTITFLRRVWRTVRAVHSICFMMDRRLRMVNRISYHVLTRVIKDMIPRYRTMKGYEFRESRMGYHGLPVELEVEKALGLDGKDQIEKYGVEPFIESVKRVCGNTKVCGRISAMPVGFWLIWRTHMLLTTTHLLSLSGGHLRRSGIKDFFIKGFKIVPYCPRLWNTAVCTGSGSGIQGRQRAFSNRKF